MSVRHMRNVKNLQKVSAIAICLLLVASCAFAAQPEATKFGLETNPQNYISYDGAFKRAMNGAFRPDVGAGLAFAGRDGSDLLFWAITDCGPSAKAPAFKKTADSVPEVAKMFPVPRFAPGFCTVRVTANKGEIGKLTSIKDSSGKPVSGLPLPSSSVGSPNERPLADDLSVLETDLQGLDPQGIDVDKKDGNLWIADNYGPFIAKLDKETGKILEKYGPGKGLPLILNLRQMDRGFCGVAATPSGKVVSVLQSVLNYDGKLAENRSLLIRMIELDPKTGDCKTFAYPNDIDAYKNPADTRLGDIAAVSDTKFLVTEQGIDKNGSLRQLVYLVDISKATGLADKLARDGRVLESEHNPAELKKLVVTMAKKTLVCDLRAMGWDAPNADGLAIVGDDTIAVISRNDFGMALKVTRPANGKDGKPATDISAYTTDYERKLHLDGKVTPASFTLSPNGKHMAFWTIKLPKALNQY